MPRSIYTKLTGRSRGFINYSQLWLAPDHILLLNSSRLSEDYKRFSLSDIQSIVVTELPPRTAVQGVMIVTALAWMSLWFAVDSRFAKWTFEITGALALLWPILDLARGARCRCYLQTRVSRELLSPVSRMSTARSFLSLVRPMIEAVQGVLPVDRYAALESAPPAVEAGAPELVTSPGYLPEILFVLFLVNSIIILASVRYPKVQDILGILLNTLFAEILLMIVALVRRRGRDARVIIYIVIALSIAAFAFDAVSIVRNIGGWYMAMIEKAKNKDTSFTVMAAFPPGKALTAAIWRAVAGSTGLLIAFLERGRSKK